MGPADNQTLVESIVKAQQSVPPSFDQHDSQLDVDEGNDVRVASTDALIVSVPLCICVYFGKGGHLIAWKTAKHDALSILKPTCFPRSLPLFSSFFVTPCPFRCHCRRLCLAGGSQHSSDARKRIGRRLWSLRWRAISDAGARSVSGNGSSKRMPTRQRLCRGKWH